ncbi:MAG: hypothetical protein K6L80_08880 [Agarilytica sp.]
MEKTPLLAEDYSSHIEGKPYIGLVSPAAPHTRLSPQTPESTRKIKQCMRLIRSLTQDLRRQQPELKTPATWLFKSLVETHYSSADENDWRTTLTATLRNIAHATSAEHRHQYTSLNTALSRYFSNNKGHTSLGDIHIFVSALLELLQSQTAHQSSDITQYQLVPT